MSKAGIQSNRGDGYQTLVAFDWALTVLSESNYEWLEVDSVLWTVDDVVIGKKDGTKIYIQAKKNQTDFRAWSMSDLEGELRKCIQLLAKDPKASIHFYSRTNFGDLASLKEFSCNYANSSSYQIALPIKHKATNQKLEGIIEAEEQKLSTYDFLTCLKFNVTEDMSRMEEQLRERLARLVTNSSQAFNTLWTSIDHLGMRSDSDINSDCQFRFTKKDIENKLNEAGAMLALPIEIEQVQDSFKTLSHIGRTWRRDIANQYLPTPIVEEILLAIDEKSSSILLTGGPGSGKTCIMLTLQEELEKIAERRNDLIPLFIQAREFVDLPTAEERDAQGLPKQWVQQVARMVDDTRVVVLIDSLDVLSIAREHDALSYFLAQIDRLLSLSNVTVVVACREFDRHYERRLAYSKWDKEFNCVPFDWDLDIKPLLTRLEIDISAIDDITRELISNPRELSLYVELVQGKGVFNVVTSQTLAQRFLDTVVRANPLLGDNALQTLEVMATEMLEKRSLSVSRQRVSCSDEVLNSLLSNQIVQESQEHQLLFGHQTLFDVLVINNALRQGITLNEFIKTLPPVPFVRPCIRSFVEYIAAGDRSEFRKQIRTVLMGNHAFHIRRLVAKSFSAVTPEDSDWPLVRDLREQHQEVFNEIYHYADLNKWNGFWLKNLVPFLKSKRDSEALLIHAQIISYIKNKDNNQAIEFWSELLELEWIDKIRVAKSLALHLRGIQPTDSAAFAELVLTLIDLLEKPHRNVDEALAYCVDTGIISDKKLWKYIVSEISDEDILKESLEQRLYLKNTGFGSCFLSKRMQQSTVLLDLAVSDIERWKEIKNTAYLQKYLTFRDGFLFETSYKDKHSQNDVGYTNSLRVLFDAVENAIVYHSNNHSDWWQENRNAICFSSEGALRYIGLKACMSSVASNHDLIVHILCDSLYLEWSSLSYELCQLLHTAFIQLSLEQHKEVLAKILTIGTDENTNLHLDEASFYKKAILIFSIPCYLRTSEAQLILDEYVKQRGQIELKPDIWVRSGVVTSPVSSEIFNNLSDAAVLKLLEHYKEHKQFTYDELFTGGESEVAQELQNAASCQPVRFMSLLSENAEQLSKEFRNGIMEGVATYLMYQHGGLNKNSTWYPKEEVNSESLALCILDELECRPNYWHHNSAAAKALKASAYLIDSLEVAERLISLAVEFSDLSEIEPFLEEDLLSVAINMTRGSAADSLIILMSRLKDINLPWPDSLIEGLLLIAADKSPAVRALLMYRLPYLQSLSFDLGWQLFKIVIQDNTEGLWFYGERCFYYAYRKNYDFIKPLLDTLYHHGSEKDLETWGRINALCVLSGTKTWTDFITALKKLNSEKAWIGAASVWTHPENMHRYKEECLHAIEVGLSMEDNFAFIVAEKCQTIFSSIEPIHLLPLELFKRCLALYENDNNDRPYDFFSFGAWLNACANFEPSYSLEAARIYFEYVLKRNAYVFDHERNFTQLLTQLFSQAEEMEESDSGDMLKRVVELQDLMLLARITEIDDWLNQAERP